MGIVLALANLKGGVSKTTLSVALAETQADGGVAALLVDADPQGSALRWADLAAEDGNPLAATTVGLPTADLARRLPALSRGQDAVVIDCPPGSLPINRAAMLVADVVLIPCQPSLSDLDRALATHDVADEIGVPNAIVLTRVRAGTRSVSATADALVGAGAHVLQAQLPQREAISAAFGTRPKGVLLGVAAQILSEAESVAAEKVTA